MDVEELLQQILGVAIWAVLIAGSILAVSILGVIVFSLLRDIYRGSLG
jgi:hypothetical protein